MNNQSNWRVEKIIQKPIPLPGFEGITIPVPHLINDRGATLVYIGSGRENQDYFLYRDGNISFKIMATRYSGADGEHITGTYNVLLGSVLRSKGLDRSEDIIDRIKCDLSAALKLIPSSEKRFPIPKITRVIFS